MSSGNIRSLSARWPNTLIQDYMYISASFNLINYINFKEINYINLIW